MARQVKSHCPIHAGLTVFGDGWTLLVVRELLRGRNSFSDLAEVEEGIATNVLADRLARLEQDGIVTKEQLRGRGNPTRYELTEKGLDLLPVLNAVAEWSLRHNPDPEARRHFRTKRRLLVESADQIRARLKEKKQKKRKEPT